MKSCKHPHLVVLQENHRRLRCRHCHLTISAEELSAGYCPECFETTGRKHDDFEEIGGSEKAVTRYRCEDCGALIDPENT